MVQKTTKVGGVGVLGRKEKGIEKKLFKYEQTPAWLQGQPH